MTRSTTSETAVLPFRKGHGGRETKFCRAMGRNIRDVSWPRFGMKLVGLVIELQRWRGVVAEGGLGMSSGVW